MGADVAPTRPHVLHWPSTSAAGKHEDEYINLAAVKHSGHMPYAGIGLTENLTQFKLAGGCT